jgi:hypothetical protein
MKKWVELLPFIKLINDLDYISKETSWYRLIKNNEELIDNPEKLKQIYNYINKGYE